MAKDLKIRPLADRVVVKVVEEADTTQGGIILPDSAREKQQKGEVLAVGAGKQLEKGGREEMDVKVGEIVLFAKYGGSDFKMEGCEYKILSVRDILAVIEE
jgi:chaperonin GroES